MSPPAAMFPELPRLLDQMVDHRQRVVRQIMGATSAAQAALAASGDPEMMSGFIRPPAIDPPPSTTTTTQLRRPALQQTLDGLARQSFWFRVFYEEIAPWGRDHASRRRQEEQDREAVERVLRQAQLARDEGAMRTAHAQQEALAQATVQDAHDQRFLSRTDQSLLNALHARGYFPNAPRSHSHQLFEGGREGPSAAAAPGGAGIIQMVTDRLGDFFDHLPVTEIGRKAMLEAWSTGQAPTQTDHRQRVLERWGILLHEASHCDYASEPAPFSPSPGRLPDEATAAMNRWIVGGLATAPRNTASLINENQADAYAAMLLLEATGHDPQARQVIVDALARRKQEAQDIDLAFLDLQAQGTLAPGAVPDSHATAWTLERVLADTDTWRGQPAQVLRKLSLRYASDGLLDFLDPTRLSADGRPVGRMLAQHVALAPGGVGEEPLLAWQVRWMIYGHAVGADPDGWLAQQDQSHPLYRAMAQTWAKAKPALNELMTQPLDHSGPTPSIRTIGDGLRALEAAAGQRRDDLLQALDLALADEENRDLLAALAARQHDLGVLCQGLLGAPGLHATPLSQSLETVACLPGLVSWRTARTRGVHGPGAIPAGPKLPT